MRSPGNGSLCAEEVLDVLLQMGLAKQQIVSKDGGVSWQGYDGKVTSFTDLDKNEDGTVGPDEFREW